jgi:cysteinyl-tRNA synthetase
MPRAMAVVQETLKSDIDGADKLATVFDFDRVLGLDLQQLGKDESLPAEIRKLVEARQKARADKNWEVSDRLRDEIQALGYVVQDAKDGMKVFRV